MSSYDSGIIALEAYMIDTAAFKSQHAQEMADHGREKMREEDFLRKVKQAVQRFMNDQILEPEERARIQTMYDFLQNEYGIDMSQALSALGALSVDENGNAHFADVSDGTQRTNKGYADSVLAGAEDALKHAEGEQKYNQFDMTAVSQEWNRAMTAAQNIQKNIFQVNQGSARLAAG